MSETWADAQFDLLEEAYNEIPIEAKARIEQLETLVRDMGKALIHNNCYRWCEPKEPCNYISEGKCQWLDRMHELGITEVLRDE